MFKIAQSHSIEHALFEPHESVKNIHLLLFTSDRGLCGGFNNNVIKKTSAFLEEYKSSEANIAMSFFGKRGYEFFHKRNCQIKKYYKGVINAPGFECAAKVGKELIDEFLNSHVDEVYLLFSEFRSTISQVPVCQRLLPMASDTLKQQASETPFIFEPSPKEILDDLVIRSMKLTIFRSLLNSVTAEHAARMTAMDSAANNCEDLVDKMTLQRNKARQAAITKELMEIVSGAESLK